MGRQLFEIPGAIIVPGDVEWTWLSYVSTAALGGGKTRYRYARPSYEYTETKEWTVGRNILFRPQNRQSSSYAYGTFMFLNQHGATYDLDVTLQVVPLDSSLNQISEDGTPVVLSTMNINVWATCSVALFISRTAHNKQTYTHTHTPWTGSFAGIGIDTYAATSGSPGYSLSAFLYGPRREVGAVEESTITP